MQGHCTHMPAHSGAAHTHATSLQARDTSQGEYTFEEESQEELWGATGVSSFADGTGVSRAR